ncbi:MAG: DUF192 domain-containing protein [Deltaproteobacteria bacterium]|nr:DUF192 domain-containing protein [Deltaproteobacteria bacterium]
MRNLDTGAVVASSVRTATSPLSRLKGLLGTASLPRGEALVIRPCTGVHTFFMKYAIDVVFVDDGGVVLAVYDTLRPYRATRIFRDAAAAIELPAGAGRESGVKEGDRLEIT